MARAGHSSYKARLIYQHPTLEQQRRIAEAIDTEVREQRNAQQIAESEAKEGNRIPLRGRRTVRRPRSAFANATAPM